MSFSNYLRSKHEALFKEATQHPFLVEAGKGTIKPEKLAAWLVQDEYYQHAYIPFIGQLIAKIHGRDGLPSTIFINNQSQGSTTEKIENKSLQHRIVDALVAAIQGLRAEESFFATTIRDYGLREYARQVEPNAATQKYLDLFEEVGRTGSLVQGLTLLWATEFVYLNAWKFARSHAGQSSASDKKSPTAAVIEEFIPNWTSNDFESVVGQLEGLVNELAEEQTNKQNMQMNEKDEIVDKVWKRALECEKNFWPTP